MTKTKFLIRCHVIFVLFLCIITYAVSVAVFAYLTLYPTFFGVMSLVATIGIVGIWVGYLIYTSMLIYERLVQHYKGLPD